jgi:hypothetical protein
MHMNKLNLLVVLTFFSSLVFAASRSDNHIECSSDNAKSTYSILQCVRSEMMYQDKDLKIKVEQFIKADADIAKTIRPYMKYLSKQIDENCEIFKNIQGDRGEIAYEKCRLDELIHYKSNVINFLEMNDAG